MARELMKPVQSNHADLSLAIKENAATMYELLDEMRALRVQVTSARDHVREGLILLHRELDRWDNQLQNARPRGDIIGGVRGRTACSK